MKLGSKSLRESLWLACCYSLLAWTVYGIVEFAFSSLAPAVLSSRSLYTPLQSETTALLFGLYEIVSLALGIAFGVLAVRMRGRIADLDAGCFFPATAQVGLLAVFLLNLIHVRPLVAIALPVALTTALAAVCIWGMLDRARFDRLRPVVNPLTVAVIIVGVPWLTKEVLWEHSLPVKLAAACSGVAAVLLLSFAVTRFLRIEQRRLAPSASLFCAAAIGMASIGFSYAFDDRPASPRLPPPPSSQTRSNVILISLDTVRADHVSLYGYSRNTTPNLDKFAAEAVVYTQALSSSNMTLGSHASMFTGLYPGWHGAHYTRDEPLGRPLSARFPTLAGILAKSGYLTIGSVANRAYLQPSFGLNRGFQYYDLQAPIFAETADFYLRSGIREVLKPALERRFGLVYRRAEEVNRPVLSLLETLPQKSIPLFLFVNYMDAHWPYSPPPPYDAMFPGKDGDMTDAAYGAMSMAVIKGSRPITAAERAHLTSQYDGGIAYMDAQLGAFFERLKQLGLYDNSLIIVTADHGEAMGDRNLIGHGISMYQDQVHVPLLIKYPLAARHEVVDEPVSSVDILPTILEVVGEKAPAGLQGSSLLHPDALKDRQILLEGYQDSIFAEWDPRFARDQHALVSKTKKLIFSTLGKRELYDLASDPDERQNLYHAGEPDSAMFTGALDALLKKVPASQDRPVALDANTVQRLKSLGYVQ
jgi:arylsulfatase A-like enzyme